MTFLSWYWFSLSCFCSWKLPWVLALEFLCTTWEIILPSTSRGSLRSSSPHIDRCRLLYELVLQLLRAAGESRARSDIHILVCSGPSKKTQISSQQNKTMEAPSPRSAPLPSCFASGFGSCYTSRGPEITGDETFLGKHWCEAFFSACRVSAARSSVIQFDPFLASKPVCTLWCAGTGLLIIPAVGSGEQVEGAVLIVPRGSDVLFLISCPQQLCFWSRLQAFTTHLSS